MIQRSSISVALLHGVSFRHTPRATNSMQYGASCMQQAVSTPTKGLSVAKLLQSTLLQSCCMHKETSILLRLNQDRLRLDHCNKLATTGVENLINIVKEVSNGTNGNNKRS